MLLRKTRAADTPRLIAGQPPCKHNEKNFVGVDIFKFFFAICIVALHTGALGVLPYIPNYFITKIILRAAVPYFFVASGFFLGKKLIAAPKERYSHIICTYCLRLLKPLLFFECISLVYYGYLHFASGRGIVYTLLKLCQTAIFYPYGALWYVQACIVGILLLYPFLKKDRLKLAFIIGIPLYGFALIANNYSFLIAGTPFQRIVEIYLKLCISARNGLFTGFISLALGILCSRIDLSTSKIKTFSSILLMVFFFVYIAEITFIYFMNPTPLDDGSLYLSHLFLIPTLFLVTVQLDIPVREKTAVLCRNLSTGIYFLHRPVLYATGYFIATGWGNFIVVLGACILICMLTYKTRPKYLYPLLK